MAVEKFKLTRSAVLEPLRLVMAALHIIYPLDPDFDCQGLDIQAGPIVLATTGEQVEVRELGRYHAKAYRTVKCNGLFYARHGQCLDVTAEIQFSAIDTHWGPESLSLTVGGSTWLFRFERVTPSSRSFLASLTKTTRVPG